MHPPLIEPDEWDEVQKRLQEAARKPRQPGGRGSGVGKATVSRLAGKIFDETGDRLTPTHSKTKQGTRIRYYVSNRLIRHGGAKDVSAWRLPGPDHEILVEHLVHQHLEAPEFPVRAVPALAAAAVATLRARIERVTAGGFSSEPQSASPLLDLVQRVDIDRGEIRILLSSARVAEMLGHQEDGVESDALVITSSFTHRKRGVETKLILAGEARPRDDTLFRNIAKAHRYLAAIRSGKTFSEIAKSEGASKRRIQHLIEFAFLAPDVVRRVHEGQQPVGLTSEWLKQNDIPADWRAQRELFATL